MPNFEKISRGNPCPFFLGKFFQFHRYFGRNILILLKFFTNKKLKWITNQIQSLYCVTPTSIRHFSEKIIFMPHFEKISRGNPCRFFTSKNSCLRFASKLHRRYAWVCRRQPLSYSLHGQVFNFTISPIFRKAYIDFMKMLKTIIGNTNLNKMGSSHSIASLQQVSDIFFKIIFMPHFENNIKG